MPAEAKSTSTAATGASRRRMVVLLMVRTLILMHTLRICTQSIATRDCRLELDLSAVLAVFSWRPPPDILHLSQAPFDKAHLGIGQPAFQQLPVAFDIRRAGPFEVWSCCSFISRPPSMFGVEIKDAILAARLRAPEPGSVRPAAEKSKSAGLCRFASGGRGGAARKLRHGRRPGSPPFCRPSVDSATQ